MTYQDDEDFTQYKGINHIEDGSDYVSDLHHMTIAEHFEELIGLGDDTTYMDEEYYLGDDEILLDIQEY